MVSLFDLDRLPVNAPVWGQGFAAAPYRRFAYAAIETGRPPLPEIERCRAAAKASLERPAWKCYTESRKRSAVRSGGKHVKIQESAENYLETILILKNRLGAVRSIDIANELEFSKPSISIAMKNLRENGYIEMDTGGFITLTPKGSEIAEKIYERHTLLSTWLKRLGVNPETAVEDACRMEHVISTESFDAIKAHVARYGESMQGAGAGTAED